MHSSHLARWARPRPAPQQSLPRPAIERAGQGWVHPTRPSHGVLPSHPGSVSASGGPARAVGIEAEAHLVPRPIASAQPAQRQGWRKSEQEVLPREASGRPNPPPVPAHPPTLSCRGLQPAEPGSVAPRPASQPLCSPHSPFWRPLLRPHQMSLPRSTAIYPVAPAAHSSSSFPSLPQVSLTTTQFAREIHGHWLWEAGRPQLSPHPWQGSSHLEDLLIPLPGQLAPDTLRPA